MTRHFASAVGSGLLLFVASEPLGWGPVAWVALIPLFVALARQERLLWGWLLVLVSSATFFAAHLWWIFLFGWMAWTALVAVMALYTSLAGLVAVAVRRLPLRPVLVAGAWTLTELIRDRWPFGGFSWGAVGTSQGSVPGVRWLAGTVGVYGLSFLIAFVAALVADRLTNGRWSRSSLAVVAAVTVAFTGIDLAAYRTPEPGEEVRLAVVQGNVPRPVRPDQRASILGSHIDLTAQLDPDDVDLVLWPEDAVGIGVRADAHDRVLGVVRDFGKPFLVGRSRIDTEAEGFINTVEHIRPDGVVADTYIKRHPVPFGEYVPLGFLRSAVGTLQAEIPYDQRPGDEAVVFDVDGVKVATPICFESAFPRDLRDYAGAELIVISTNNSSFERSYASQQHLAHTRMRALENRQTIVQSALAGISAIVRPDGRIDHATELFERTSFVDTVQVRPASSLYHRTGDLYPGVFALASLAALVVARLRRREDRTGF